MSFGARHLAAIGFVIHAQQMQNAMQHQHRDLVAHRMAVLDGLLFGSVEGDCDLAQGAIRISKRPEKRARP